MGTILPEMGGDEGFLVVWSLFPGETYLGALPFSSRDINLRPAGKTYLGNDCMVHSLIAEESDCSGGPAK